MIPFKCQKKKQTPKKCQPEIAYPVKNPSDVKVYYRSFHTSKTNKQNHQHQQQKIHQRSCPKRNAKGNSLAKRKVIPEIQEKMKNNIESKWKV